jgi:hypothetical protein
MILRIIYLRTEVTITFVFAWRYLIALEILSKIFNFFILLFSYFLKQVVQDSLGLCKLFKLLNHFKLFDF